MFERITQRCVNLISLNISDKDFCQCFAQDGRLARVLRHIHTPQKVVCVSQLRHTPHGKYAIFLRIRITPLYAHRHKLLYEELGSQRWYLQPLGYSILQGTPSLNNLAALYFNQGKPKEALPLLERAYRICKKTLGSNHPNTKQLEEGLKILRKMC